MNSHSTCQNGLKQATISGTSKHCRSVFDGRWELRNTISFRSTPLHQTFYFPSQVLIHAPVRQVLRGCWAASQFLTNGWSSKRGTESRIPNHPRKMGCHIELNLWNQQHKLATNRGRKNCSLLGLLLHCMPSVLCLLSQSQIVAVAHNKHKASCSQPPLRCKNCSETRTGCISLSSSVHEVSHFVSQGHWCWIILVHVVH